MAVTNNLTHYHQLTPPQHNSPAPKTSQAQNLARSGGLWSHFSVFKSSALPLSCVEPTDLIKSLLNHGSWSVCSLTIYSTNIRGIVYLLSYYSLQPASGSTYYRDCGPLNSKHCLLTLFI